RAGSAARRAYVARKRDGGVGLRTVEAGRGGRRRPGLITQTGRVPTWHLSRFGVHPTALYRLLPSPPVPFRLLRRLMRNHDALESLRAVPRRVTVECRGALLFREDIGTDELVLPRADALCGEDARNRRRDRDALAAQLGDGASGGENLPGIE